MPTISDDWSTADLVACLQRADPESAGQVTRVLAARIDRDAGSVTDPRSLIYDLSCVVEFLASVVERVIGDACAEQLAEDEYARRDLRLTVTHLKAAVGDLDAIADGWI